MTHNPKTFFEAYWTPQRLRGLPRVAERCPSAPHWRATAGRTGPWSDLLLVPPVESREAYTAVVGCRQQTPDTIIAYLSGNGEYGLDGPQPDLGIEAAVYLDVMPHWGVTRIRPQQANQYLALHSAPRTIATGEQPGNPNYRRYTVKLEPEPSPDDSRDPDWDRPQPVVPEASGDYRNGVWHSDYGPPGAA